MPTRIAIVAALQREISPLVKGWKVSTVEHDGREFTFYESAYAVLVCGGIGPAAARRAAEAIIVRYSPEIIISAGSLELWFLNFASVKRFFRKR